MGCVVSALRAVCVEFFWKLHYWDTGESRIRGGRLLFIILIGCCYFDRRSLPNEAFSIFSRQRGHILLRVIPVPRELWFVVSPDSADSADLDRFWKVEAVRHHTRKANG